MSPKSRDICKFTSSHIVFGATFMGKLDKRKMKMDDGMKMQKKKI